MPAHPMDEALGKRRWRRTLLDEIGSESSKLAGRIITRSITRTGGQALFGIVDVHLWRSGQNIRMEFATTLNIPPMFHTLIAQGVLGISPLALGLTPCSHEPPRWNPFCLPLTWQQEMNDRVRMDVIVRRYARTFEDPSWQCPDAALLMR